jgi:predicted RNase H-like nuclease (RuvC/YqgF family)
LLFILVHRKRAKAGKIAAKQIVKKPSTIGSNLDSGKQAHQGFAGDSNSSTIVSILKNNVSQNRWKETTKKWKNLQKLVEQLQEETAKYKQAEEALEQQFARLKAANERLRQEITGSEQIIKEADLSQHRTIGSLGNK